MNMTMFLILYDIGIAIIMLLLGWSFYRSNGKASKFLTGYNMRSEKDRKTHAEEVYMCKNYGIRMMIMAIPFVIGAVIDFLKVGVGCTFAWIVWIIFFVLLLIKKVSFGRMKNHFSKFPIMFRIIHCLSISHSRT